ncbi:ABC transporter substrate-binding protein [Haloarcula marismortui]|jgi:spermidine/putrescine transport system substrate-binding protein|uniref:Extracellular solute-binding protein n=1 Tax=Haloarcula marismortui ATCC 33800 TaxID=662476 RepID=M0JSS4_9EURY|nr:substrate-binding domain-containing protein [Haloarcula sinaiiensis]EMA10745.1 spermidine/putrescine transporter substrate binding protein [Haloarcula sinaiiensis ATCC 33800]QUJ74590.1 extracellular solute-binding protein [Haloarcula sinaiiensis ATCC 33800]
MCGNNEHTESEPIRQSGTSRRRFLTAAGAGTAGVFAGCASLASDDGDGGTGGESGGASTGDSSSGQDFSGETLRVMVWSGNYADRFEETIKPMYEERTGGRLQVNRGWNEILAKIRSAPEDQPPFDVTITEGYFYLLGRNDDLFLPVREENVPNLDGVIDYYTDFRTTEFGVPVDGAPTTLIYRNDLDFEPTTWADLAAPEAANGNGIGIDKGFWWFPQHDAAVAMDAKELAGEVYDEDLSMDVFDYMEEQWNIQGWASSGEDIWQLFENGIIDHAQWYYEQTAYDIDDYPNLSHTAPDRNSGFVNHWCPVRGTDKRRMAEDFLNFLLDAETQTRWSENSPTLFTNTDMEYATEKLNEDLPNNSDEAALVAWPEFDYINSNFDSFNQRISEMEASSN